ncbi:hypothetical protein PVK06_015592 [Gossypium arboreum]|uniref:Uncharacterized protein n=1 Tax=Gossypium arboreum TaxID=29729 RepID=A0ABR0PXQ4_GOSAR|nr:hypothetical protein PVK06_015592 [Gossypium arboreum]
MASNTKTLLHFEDLALPSVIVMSANKGCAQCREKVSKVTSKMTGRNFDGLRMGQVSKVVEVEGLEIYCSICKDAAKDLSLSNTRGSESWFNSHSVGDKSEHIVEPFNVSLSLLDKNTNVRSNQQQYENKVSALSGAKKDLLS